MTVACPEIFNGGEGGRLYLIIKVWIIALRLQKYYVTLILAEISLNMQ